MCHETVHKNYCEVYDPRNTLEFIKIQFIMISNENQ